MELGGTLVADSGAAITLQGVAGSMQTDTSFIVGVRVNNIGGGNGIVANGGTISVTGSVVSTQAAQGIGVQLGLGPIIATTSLIILSGSSTTNNPNSAGLNVSSGMTAASLLIHDSSAGTGGGNGVGFNGTAVGITGSVIATLNIQSGTGAGAIGMLPLGIVAGGPSEFAATGRGTGASHGISLQSGGLSTVGTASIILTGTGSAIGTNAHGINVGTGGGANSNSGSITLIGTGQGNSTNHGINFALNSTNALRSTSGNIFVSGNTTSTASDARGVSIAGVGWSPGTTGIVTFLNCTGGGGANSHGINVAATCTFARSVFATNNIVSGTGAGSVGFHVVGATFSITGGATTTMQISATSQAAAGGGHGIWIDTGGRLTATNSASIILNGTSSNSSDTPSYGINLAASDPIIGLAGPMTLVGTSTCAVAQSHGIRMPTTWTTGTTGTVSLTGSVVASGAYPIALGATFSTGGPVVFNSLTGLTQNGTVTVTGTGVMNFVSNLVGNFNATLTAPSAAIAVNGSIDLSGATNGANLFVNSDQTFSVSALSSTGTSGNGGNITILTNSSISVSGTVSLNGGTNGGVLTGTANSVVVFDQPVLVFGSNGNGGIVSIVSTGDQVVFNQIINATGTTSGGTVTINAFSFVDCESDILTTATTGSAGPVSITCSSGEIFVAGLIDASGNTNGADITVIGDGTLTLGGQILTPGTMGNGGSVTLTSTNGPISVAQDVILTGGVLGGNLDASGDGTLTFSAEIDAEGGSGSGGAVSLNSTTGGISVAGATHLSGATGGNLTATGDLLISFANISSIGSSLNGGSVTLTSSSSSISVNNVNTSGGMNGGNISLAPSGTYAMDLPTGIITLNGALSATGTVSGGIVTLDAGRASAATIATIASNVNGNDITIEAESIVVGDFEAMTALGNMTLTAPTMIVGDLVALDAMTVTATNNYCTYAWRYSDL